MTPILAVLILASAGAGPEGLQEQSRELPEYVVKAGFLFNFAKYVEWPSGAFKSPDDPIRIGIAGEDPFGEVLEKALKDKVVDGRRFSIERFKKPSDVGRVHILFVARSETSRVGQILDRVRAAGTLTVGEDAAFARSGGVLSILIEDGKPKLEVNPDAAAKQKVTISAKLLKVATVVRTEK